MTSYDPNDVVTVAVFTVSARAGMERGGGMRG